MDVRLDGRTAIITGGSKGLGFAMASKFAESGAKVVLAARDAATCAEAEAQINAKVQGAAKAIATDVTDPAQCQALYDGAVAQFGQVDILVNNAGQSQTGKFEDITDEIWEADLALKLMAQVRMSRLCLPAMKERRWGRIINVLNTGAKAPRAGGAPTAVTRAAGMALSKVLAGEGAPFNVLVNAMNTGLIVSDQHVRRWKAGDQSKTLDEFLADVGKNLPMGRMGTAEEFANLACFLASDAGGYINGTAINVDGGMCPVV
ncbi:MAG: SDR family oxidoreductase [Alphaproteobacteria bacterium]|nr:SDR family oxidoreductase [Alphaproteobacteria bacterium]MCB9929848.1 SDR family oxidoreductase [Alphaproteobacteria bacterium]